MPIAVRSYVARRYRKNIRRYRQWRACAEKSAGSFSASCAGSHEADSSGKVQSIYKSSLKSALSRNLSASRLSKNHQYSTRAVEFLCRVLHKNSMGREESSKSSDRRKLAGGNGTGPLTPTHVERPAGLASSLAALAADNRIAIHFARVHEGDLACLCSGQDVRFRGELVRRHARIE